MDLEIIILSGISLTEKDKYHLYMMWILSEIRDYHTKWNKSDRERQISFIYDVNTLIYETEIDSWTWETNLWLPKGKKGRGYKLGVWD